VISAKSAWRGSRILAESRADDSKTVQAKSSNGFSFCAGMMGSMAVFESMSNAGLFAGFFAS
jgi:hypothetical protein